MKIEQVTFFRFIAASIVVFFHYGKELIDINNILIAGPEMVTFFFVLSGFVMSISYLDKEINHSLYIIARLSRIMPNYLLALTFSIILFLLEKKEVSIVTIILNITLLQSWISPYPTSLNSPGWSLSVEIFFYFAFPFVLFLIKKYKISPVNAISYSLFTWFLTQVSTTYAISTGYCNGERTLIHDLIYYFPITHFCSFLMGISGGMLVKTKNDFSYTIDEKISLLLVIFSLLLISITISSKEKINDIFNLRFAYASSFFAPMFLFFILSLSICSGKIINFLNQPPLILLGRSSYALYIFQDPIHAIFKRHLFSIFHFPSYVNFAIFFSILTILSVSIFHFFENPINVFLRKQLSLFIKKCKSIQHAPNKHIF